jgi:molybdate transport system substrate-binding protein
MMKFLLWPSAVLLLWGSRAFAQTPAQPADPNTPIPAQPVQPAPVIAPPPAATNSAMSPGVPSTNAAAANASVPAPAGPQLFIIADGSLKAVLTELAQTWADGQDVSPQMPITLTNAGTMRAKIEAGGTWDLAIDADIGDTKALTDQGFLSPDDQRSLARNTLVIYGRAPLVKDDELDWFDLIGTEWKKVAIGNPALTASGRVAQRALGRHDLLDDDHKGDFIDVPNEMAGLQAIQRQQADAAFIFKTDLAAANVPGFGPVLIKPEDAPPIFYTAAIFRQVKNAPLARSFLDFISSSAARPIWTKYGFETD